MNEKKKYAFIWDLDGTLLDSCGEIASSTRLAFAEYGIEMDENYIRDFTARQSGTILLKKVSEESGIPYEYIFTAYRRYHREKSDEVLAAEHAKEILATLTEQGIPCFVFTHRGKTTIPILKRLQLHEYFTEIITRESGFARKPAPDAVFYLLQKYQLEPRSVYLVGDRQMDMECAEHAGVRKILYCPDSNVAEPSGKEEYVIRDFLEIPELIF